MLTLALRVGQAVQIGDGVVIKLEQKSGQQCRMAFATDEGPIRILEDGVIPPAFVERSRRRHR